MISPEEFNQVTCLICGKAPKIVYSDGNTKVTFLKVIHCYIFSKNGNLFLVTSKFRKINAFQTKLYRQGYRESLGDFAMVLSFQDHFPSY